MVTETKPEGLAAVGRLLLTAYRRLESREADERAATLARRAHSADRCPACSPRLDAFGAVVPPLPWERAVHEVARDGLTDAQVAFNLDHLRAEVRRLKAAGASSFPENHEWEAGRVA